MTLPYSLTRTVFIEAHRETVFAYFIDSTRWASWWGKGSQIDPRPGGAMRIVYPNAVEAAGEVLEIAPPEKIVFTFGYSNGTPIPAGSSRVTIRLEQVTRGTVLHFQHDFADPAVCEQHVQGWRYQLSLFSNVVANSLHADAAKTVGAWYRAWAITDAAEREAALAAICAPDMRFQNGYSNFDNLADLNSNIGAVQRFMPGLELGPHGAIRQCQGTVLSDWATIAADGSTAQSGTSVFHLNADGKIASAVSIQA